MEHTVAPEEKKDAGVDYKHEGVRMPITRLAQGCRDRELESCKAKPRAWAVIAYRYHWLDRLMWMSGRPKRIFCSDTITLANQPPPQVGMNQKH